MPLVEMEPHEAIVAERPQHPDPAEAEHGLLTQAVQGVAAAEDVCDGPIIGRVLGQVGVEQ
jgi:hypothetical protein